VSSPFRQFPTSRGEKVYNAPVYTPFDWQEAIGHRAQFVESRIALGSPVAAASFDFGILMLTYRRQARKLFEVYDRLAMGAIGQQSDIEALRIASVDFAHQQGYTHSEQDVTLQRVLAAISAPVKRAFADFSMAPFVAQAVFAEVCERPEDDRFAFLEYDGDFHVRGSFGFLAPTTEVGDKLEGRLRELKRGGVSENKAIDALDELWRSVADQLRPESGSVLEEELMREIAVLERKPKGEVRFRHPEDEPRPCGPS